LIALNNNKPKVAFFIKRRSYTGHTLIDTGCTFTNTGDTILKKKKKKKKKKKRERKAALYACLIGENQQ